MGEPLLSMFLSLGYQSHNWPDDAKTRGALDVPVHFEVWHSPATGSTNADLAALVASGDAAPGTVLITDHQRSGKGRQDRTWLDEPGTALLSSVYWQVPRRSLPVLPFAVGLAVSDAVGELCGRYGLTGSPDSVVLKWPNDVLVPTLGERKLAGILVEVSPDIGSSSFAAVIGMGLNVRRAPSMPNDVASRVATLEDVVSGGLGGSPKVSRDQILGGYLRALEARLAAMEDPPAVLDAYRSRCATLGRTVRFETASETVVGTAIDVDDDGALAVVGQRGERHRLTAGDAHHL